jgi:NADP-dependent 3-hydroxy acid dehydrogenase YdfG
MQEKRNYSSNNERRVAGSSKGIGKAIAMEFANAGAMQDFISQGIIL